jgi:Ca2+-binding EF-hand superfamily protein
MRNIIEDLFSVEKSMQKIELIERCKVFKEFGDKYDELNVKTLFTDYDEDFDHLLATAEFYKLLEHLAGFLPENKDEIFTFTDANGDGKVSYTELRDNFPSIIKMIRVKNILRDISNIIRK